MGHTTRDSCILYGWSGISSCIESFDFDCWWILLRMLRCWSVLAAYTDCYEHGTTAWHAQNGTKATKVYLDAKLSAALEKSKILINIVSPPHMQLLVRCNYHVIYNTQQWVTASQTIRVYRSSTARFTAVPNRKKTGGNGLMMMIPCWHDLLWMWWLQRWQYSCCCKKAKWVIRRPRRACLLASDSIRLMKS